MASGMFGEAKNTKKDILADLISVKHELHACIQDVSVGKTMIGDSETKIKADVQHIHTQLSKMLKKIFEGATHEASVRARAERVKLNEDIIELEEQYKSVEAMEQHMKTISNTNLKPLQEGKDKCEETSEIVEKHRENFVQKQLQFVLHPLLAYLMGQVETFSMGEVKLMPLQDVTNAVEATDTIASNNAATNQSTVPGKSSFMRSNSSKLIQMSSRSNSTLSTNSTRSRGKGAIKSDSVTLPKQVERKSLLIIKRSRKDNEDVKVPTKNDIIMEDPEQLLPVTGLSATLAVRSKSAPNINNLPKQTNKIKDTETKQTRTLADFHMDSTMTTKAHKSPCFITGVTTLTNGNTVICDSVHDSLQLFDTEHQLISEIEVIHPWGVTAVSDTAVAASMSFDKKIILAKTEGALQRIHENDITLKCDASLLYDVKYMTYRLYCLCGDGDIHVVDLKGRQYACIKTGMPIDRQKYLELNEAAGCIYTSGEMGVACRTMDGLPLWHFKLSSNRTFAPTGIILYKGVLLVLDWENNALVEIVGDGHTIRTVSSDGLQKPLAICSTPDGNGLLVSQGDYDMSRERTRTVKILSCAGTDSVLEK